MPVRELYKIQNKENTAALYRAPEAPVAGGLCVGATVYEGNRNRMHAVELMNVRMLGPKKTEQM